MRGVPINVDIPVDGGTMSVSLSLQLCPFGRALMTWALPFSVKFLDVIQPVERHRAQLDDGRTVF